MRFSILIPMHNASKHVKKALDSVKKQSFKDYELIAICDACEDNTADIARKYPDKVIEVDNHLVGPTLNAGLDIAQGDYILFMDDDDWWMHEFVLEMLNMALEQTDADVLCFSFIWKGVGYARYNANNGGYFPAVWNKAWNRSFIGDHRFGTRKHDSDLVFHNEMMVIPHRNAEWDQAFYYYNYLRKGSLTAELKAKEKE